MNDDELQAKILEHVRELLVAHWPAAKASADEDGRFGIAFAAKVTDGNPVKLKVTSRISFSVSDSIESSIHLNE